MNFGDVYVEENSGKQLKGADWDEINMKENSICIDTRNTYEVEMGTFKNSVNPETGTFKEFPQWVLYKFIPNIDK